MNIFENTYSIGGHSNESVLTCEERVELLKLYIQKKVTPERIIENARMAVFKKPDSMNPDDIQIFLTLTSDLKEGCSLTVRTPVVSLDISSVNVPGFELYFIDDVLATYTCSVDILEDTIKVRLNNTPPEVSILCAAESESGIDGQVFDVNIKKPNGFQPHDFDSNILAGLGSIDICAATLDKKQLENKVVKLEF